MVVKKSEPGPERDATPHELKALGHPLRWRILRITLERPLTNKEIAERLGRDPGTTLHHVRILAESGFLAAEEIRAGTRGARERPYRSTGKSWRVRLTPTADNTVAILDAAREEILEAGPDAAIGTLRLAVNLKPDDLDELRRRISELGDEFAARGDPAGQPVGIVALVHRRKP